MRCSRHHLSRLTILVLVAALLPSLALEAHGTTAHLAPTGFDDGAVFLADHDEADRTLHIEPVGAMGVKHCQGCLMPKKQTSTLAHRPLATPLVAVGAGLALSRDAGWASSPPATLAPRAPPLS